MDMDFAMFQQIASQVENEKNVAARFYDKAVKTSEVSEKGLPIFKNVTYVEIRIKDNNTEVFNQPATEEKIKRFPKEYALYKMSKEQAKDGTPLEQFSFLSAAEIATCKARGVFTVEALAELDYAKVNSLGLQNEHVLAQMFLETSGDNLKLKKFAEREKEYKSKIAELEEKVASLQEKLKHTQFNWKKNKENK